MNKTLETLEGHFNPKKAAENLAKKLGVSLAATPAPTPAPATVKSTGWLAKVMPNAAQMMAELKAQLPPEIYQDALATLKRGGGYVVDHETRIAVGSPPVDRFERGKIDTKDGFTVMRVRSKEADPRDALPCPRASAQCPRLLLVTCPDASCVKALSEAAAGARRGLAPPGSPVA